MTAQIADSIRINGKTYDRIAGGLEPGFHPAQFGLDVQWCTTACWRGFWCEYEITDGELLLQALHVYCGDDAYPTLFGVEAAQEDPYGMRVYRGLKHRVAASGTLLLGRDFLIEYYVHMGFQDPWAFRELLEVEVQDGKVVQLTDRSAEAEAMRQRMDREE